MDLSLVKTTNQTLLLDAGSGFVSYLWSDNSTGQILSLSNLAAGSYKYWVEVTNNYNCTGSDSILVTSIVDDNTSVEDIDLPPEIYPNPTKGTITLNLHSEGLREMTLYDVTGRRVMVRQLSDHLEYINLSTYQRGLYLIKVEENDKVYKHVVVKM